VCEPKESLLIGGEIESRADGHCGRDVLRVKDQIDQHIRGEPRIGTDETASELFMMK
jgi:hypothetical protein